MSFNKRYLDKSSIIIFGEDSKINVEIQERIAREIPDIEDKIYTYSEEEYEEALEDIKRLGLISFILCSGNLHLFSVNDIFNNFSKSSRSQGTQTLLSIFSNNQFINPKCLEDLSINSIFIDTPIFLKNIKYFNEIIFKMVSQFNQENHSLLLPPEIKNLIRSEINDSFKASNYSFARSLFQVLKNSINLSFEEETFLDAGIDFIFCKESKAFRISYIQELEKVFSNTLEHRISDNHFLYQTWNIFKNLLHDKDMKKFQQLLSEKVTTPEWELEAPFNALVSSEKEIIHLLGLFSNDEGIKKYG